MKGLSASFLLWLTLAAACAGVDADPPRPRLEPAADAGNLQVRRGRLETRLLLTGTLEAVRSVQITAPRVPGSELQIRWMEEDGTTVQAGQRVLEFDNSTYTADLEDKKLAASREEKELRRLSAQARAEGDEKAFAVEERRAALDKARLEADVPKELLPLREYLEKQLALERARAEHDKAEADLETHLRTKQKEIELKTLGLEKTRFEIRFAERAIEALTLVSPRDGVFVVADIPWEGRKLQVGDNVWPGFVLARLPDLAAMEVVARLSDVDDGQVQPGMMALVTLDAYPDDELQGSVDSVTPVAQEASPRSLRRGFTVHVSLAARGSERMRPGMAARVTVSTESKEEALLVPRAALDLSRSPPVVLLENGETMEITLDGCGLFECALAEGSSALSAQVRLGVVR
jgi:multidrug resistance efflux pump